MDDLKKLVEDFESLYLKTTKKSCVDGRKKLMTIINNCKELRHELNNKRKSMPTKSRSRAIPLDPPLLKRESTAVIEL